ncbi:P-loop containing nucleoside triphosphate hydrolase protein [Mycena albidolilacea]|uniref:P-loop containing nucleoside triphosphate hydrolase protein n=1 Tax=Mycena albidolilacea TaxID=1033008 RepID=A0AAD7AMW7_9AGAR|nr:P-loop containing nucleoside triphosphate hydrolase protein [Mycena albidolilacea]
MLSAFTGLFSSLSILPAADVPLHPQLCTCLYPDLSRNLEELCKKCGNLQSVLLGDTKQEDVDEPFPITFKVSSRTGLKSPRRLTREPTKSEVQYLNDRLTASLASISSEQVLVARKGELVVFENGESLYKYQAVDLERILAREAEGKGTILAYAMGLGKTVVSSALICYTNKTSVPDAFRTTLVIAPSVGILQHWKTELKRFAPKLQVLLYHGDRRKTSDPRDPDVALVTLSEVRNQYAAYTDDLVSDESKFMLYTGKFKRIIIDEAQAIRNPESASAKACWALEKCHAMCLSGTPAQNKFEDLFSLFGFLDVEAEGLNDLGTFRSRVSNPYKDGEIVKTTDLLVRVLTTEVTRYCTSAHRLTPSEREVYRYIQFIHPFKSHWAQFVRLRQAADHPALLKKALHRGDIGPKPDDTSEQMRAVLDKTCAEANEVISQDRPLLTIPPGLQTEVFEETYVSSKFTALLDIQKQIPKGEKMIIFSHFLTNLKMIKAMFDRKGVSCVRCLNIPACNRVVLVEPWWNPYVEDQAISRVHRIGQVREVQVYRLLVKDSIEDSIVKTQAAKREVIGGLLSLCAVPDENEMLKWLA